MTSGDPSRWLTDGVFDLDELERDISAADAKFAGRKYKPTALILEYLTARAGKQNAPVPSFVNEKSSSTIKKRVSDGNLKQSMKRFSATKQRPVYHTEQEPWEADEDHQQLEEDWEEDHAEGDDSVSWDSLAFQQKSTFPPCTTQFCKDRNIAHTHSTERCYKLQPPKGKGASGKGAHSLLFTKGSKVKGREQGKGKGKPGKGKGLRKGKAGKGKQPKGLGRSLDDTCHFCKRHDITKRNVPSTQP
jgi:hypothetical protein